MASVRPRILIVDDDENVLEVISAGLREAGYLVDTARNASEAFEKSGTKPYNLAIVEIRLPDMDGTKLLTGMKQARPEMITIILTGYPTLQNAVEAVNDGADAYLVKPVRMNDLLEVVRLNLQKQEELGSVTAVATRTSWFCNYCGKSNFPERKSCGYCGRKRRTPDQLGQTRKYEDIVFKSYGFKPPRIEESQSLDQAISSARVALDQINQEIRKHHRVKPQMTEPSVRPKSWWRKLLHL